MTVSDFSKELINVKSAVIFCHTRPDGDTLSCAFALYYAFKKLGKQVRIACGTKVPESNLCLLPFLPDETADLSVDAFISVDTPTSEQLGSLCNVFTRHKKTFCIDHHLSNDRYAKFNLVENLPSCTLVIYEVIKALNVEVDKQIANYLLTGIITDTNNFSVVGLDASVFQRVSEFIELGADFSEVFEKAVCNLTKNKVAVFGKALSKIKYYHDDKLAVMTVTKKDLDEFSANEDVTVGLVDYLTKIVSVDVGVCILEAKNNFFRISFRSNKVNVSEIASVFGGGGHKNASGAALHGYYEDVVDKIVFTVGNYLL